MSLQQELRKKIKESRTRKVTYEGLDLNVKIYTGKELDKVLAEMRSGDDEKAAEAISKQFVDDHGKPVLDKEFILSEDCTNAFIGEAIILFIEVNNGLHKKK